ncbi:proteophosphoglycan-related [Euphorbia peplus]|nr:proteophosphoglycan-related [Euphorbia peplus]
MARTNKYSSINFNHIYEKSSNSPNPQSKHPSSSSSSSSSSSPGLYSVISSPNGYKNQFSPSGSPGRMLVLTRPSPKPVAPPPTTISSSPKNTQLIPSHNSPESDPISLRPGGGGSPKEIGGLVGSPKTNKFVPPHLRPGFSGREERPGPEVFRGKELNHRQLQSPPPHQQQAQGGFGSPGFYGEDGRPKSGGYDRRGRGGYPDPSLVNRPRSSGNRPNSSGLW